MGDNDSLSSLHISQDNQTDKQRDMYNNLTNMTRQACILSQDLDSNCDTKSKAVWPFKKASVQILLVHYNFYQMFSDHKMKTKNKI